MATNYTAADLATIDRAISQNVREVTFADGRNVVFSTFEELVNRRNFIARQLGEEAGRQRLRMKFEKGVS